MTLLDPIALGFCRLQVYGKSHPFARIARSEYRFPGSAPDGSRWLLEKGQIKNKKEDNIAWGSPKMADDEGLADRYQVLEELGRESHR